MQNWLGLNALLLLTVCFYGHWLLHLGISTSICGSENHLQQVGVLSNKTNELDFTVSRRFFNDWKCKAEFMFAASADFFQKG